LLDKGKATAITIETCNKHTRKLRKVIFKNQLMVFIHRAEGFGGKFEGNDAHSFFVCHAPLS